MLSVSSFMMLLFVALFWVLRFHLLHDRGAHVHGFDGGIPAHAETALGRVPEQVLQSGRHQV